MNASVEVRRSARRRRTVSAYEESGRLVVLIPATFSRAQEKHWVDRMSERVAAKRARRSPGDTELATRAVALSKQYLGGRARPISVRWVANQQRRWGSCTPAAGTIRVSDQLRGMPSWVLDYVLLHELAHLLEPGHGPRFWALVAGYPRLERARGYLEGVAATAGLSIDPDDTDGPDSADDAQDIEDTVGV
ncbi:MAG: M48 family metallopeptidase [Micrococcales bacterium]|nr:M48 family metallopeptidase [Micrococcales bacterium]